MHVGVSAARGGGGGGGTGGTGAWGRPMDSRFAVATQSARMFYHRKRHECQSCMGYVGSNKPGM